LVDEFSTLARFPVAKPQPADLNEIVKALSPCSWTPDGSPAQVLSSDLPKVLADSEAIKRAVANLVDNAPSPAEFDVREIEISTALVGSRDAVRDSQSPTPATALPGTEEKSSCHIFRPKKRGTGLGLAIVSRIVEDHHGSIRVEENRPSAPDSSSNCRCSGAPRPRRPHLNMHKILIVDDEAGIRESLAGILADEGYSASSTTAARSASTCYTRTPSTSSSRYLAARCGWPRDPGKNSRTGQPPEVIMISATEPSKLQCAPPN